MELYSGYGNEKMTTHGLPIVERFERYISPEPNSGCWLWMGFGSINGYGCFAVDSKPVKAHRLAWQLYRGELSPNAHVLHKCDVRCCVNPDHLFVGTNADNVADKVAKGRQSRANAKIDFEIAQQIRLSPLSDRAAAKQFGIGKSGVNLIRQGKLWRRK